METELEMLQELIMQVAGEHWEAKKRVEKNNSATNRRLLGIASDRVTAACHIRDVFILNT
jgi:hypothetical protein